MSTSTLRITESARRRESATGLRALFVAVHEYLVRRREQRGRRMAFLNLTRLDDHVLDDIGVTREEVERAAAMPLEVDAARALQAMARRRRLQDETPERS